MPPHGHHHGGGGGGWRRGGGWYPAPIWPGGGYWNDAPAVIIEVPDTARIGTLTAPAPAPAAAPPSTFKTLLPYAIGAAVVYFLFVK